MRDFAIVTDGLRTRITVVIRRSFDADPVDARITADIITTRLSVGRRREQTFAFTVAKCLLADSDLEAVRLTGQALREDF